MDESYFFYNGAVVHGVLQFHQKRSTVLTRERAVEHDLHVYGRRYGRYGHDARTTGVLRLARK